MRAKEKIFDDMARMAGGTVGILSGLRKQIREDIKARLDEAVLKFDLVPREDFERLEAVLAETRKRLDEQTKKIEQLEQKLKGKAPSKTKKSAKSRKE